jgi:hypothetical protein
MVRFAVHILANQACHFVIAASDVPTCHVTVSMT